MINYTMHKSVSLNQPWPYLFVLQILLAMTLIHENIGAVCANAVTPEIPTVSDNENDFMVSNDAAYEEKRNWQSLQGPWGKRATNDVDFNAEMPDGEELVPVLLATNLEQKPKMQLAFLANPAAIEHFSNAARPLASYENNDSDDESIFNEKRGWKKMNVAWGKRRNAGQSWNRDFVPYAAATTGSWGKREPNWTNLKGMWGKRAAKGWLKLNNGWGKRTQQYTETN